MENIGGTDTKHIAMSLENIEVGILFAPVIRFRLNGQFLANGEILTGDYTVKQRDGHIVLQGTGDERIVKDGFTLYPQGEDATFDLPDVTIGIHFHWERREEQRFRGALKIVDEGQHLTAVNVVLLEEYLTSVISSEMSATSSRELLKAHAVISRSWLLAQKINKGTKSEGYSSCRQNEREYIRWFDREDHERFDVCADDHCQRYQGISRAYTPAVQEAIEATRGEILTYRGEICDARFSKCCGGITERFESAWEDTPHPYLRRVADSGEKGDFTGDLRQEAEARRWVLSSPDVFCNTTDKQILSNVLNDYDQETRDFFRWSVSYTTEELSELIREKLGMDFGRIIDLEAIERGVSGRIIRLRVTGTLRSLIIGKELLIRKALSPSHLYSSAFVVDKETDAAGNPVRFTFRGAGWGHGVGLCQIGAAVMSARGYSYREILAHYFPETQIEQLTLWKKTTEQNR